MIYCEAKDLRDHEMPLQLGSFVTWKHFVTSPLLLQCRNLRTRHLMVSVQYQVQREIVCIRMVMHTMSIYNDGSEDLIILIDEHNIL